MVMLLQGWVQMSRSKLPIIADVAWSDVATDKVNIGFHVKNYINVDNL